MDFSYPKKERLKNKKAIEGLFSEGQSVSKYPLRLVFIETPEETEPIKMGVSVSKKNFKKAVDRNYFKRLLRESYRLNKKILADGIKKKYAVMFFYQTKERLTFEEINEKTVLLFHKWVQFLNEKNLEN